MAILLGGFFLSLTLWYSFGMDQSLYSYGAWVWTHYHLPPYLGVFDQNFPGIFIIHRLAFAIFGESIIGFRVFDLLVQLSSLTMIFYLSKRLSGSGVAGFLSGVFYGIYYFGLGNFDTGQREAYILWLFLISLIAGVTLKKRAWSRAILVGLILGFAFLVKPFYGLGWLVFGFWFVREGESKDRLGARLSKLVLFAVCCLIPSILIILYYWKAGHLKELYQATILYNFQAYRAGAAAGPGPFWDKPLIVISSLSWPNSLIIFSGIFAIWLRWSNRQVFKENALFFSAILLCLCSLVSYWLQGKFFPYQLITLMGLLMVLSGAGWSWIETRLRQGLSAGRGRLFSWGFYPGLIFLMMISLSPDLVSFSFRHSFRSLDQAYLAGLARPVDTHYSSNNYLVAKKLKEMIKPEDEMEYFGPYPLIPFLLQKKLPSRFGCVQHLLFVPGSAKMRSLEQQWIAEYTQAVISARPKFFLVSDYFPGSRHKFFNLAGASLKGALREKFPDLQKFLDRNYQLLMKEGMIEVYQLKADSAGKE